MKFEYEWRNTVLHRMHPLAKITLFFSIGTVLSAWMDFRYSLIGLLFALTLWRMGEIPKGWSKVLLATAIAGWTSIVLWLPFQSVPRVYKVLPEDYAMMTILDLGTVPYIGRAIYTYGTVWIYLNSLIKSATMMSLSLILIYTTSPSDVTQILLKFGVPNAVSFAFMTFFRFSRIMSRAAGVIVNSHRLRGWEGAKTRNPVKFIRQIVPVMRGIGLQFITTTNSIAVAITNRGFGGGRRVPHKILTLSATERMIMVISVLVSAAVYLLCIFPPYLGNI